MPQAIVVLMLLAAAAAAAHEAETLRSQARAKQLIDAAVAAIGGEAALLKLRSVRRDYVEDWVDVGQGLRPWDGVPAADALPPHAYSDDAESIAYLDYAGGRLYLRARFMNAPNDYGLFVDAVTPEGAFQAFTFVRERPFLTERARAEGEELRQQHLRRHPEGLLRIALDRPETLLALGPAEEGGIPYELVAFADRDGTQLVLYLDARTHLPARVETRRSHRVYGDTTADVVYSDYRPAGALRLPHAWTTRVAGIPVSRFQAHAVTVDAPADESWFRPPSEFARAEASPPRLRVEQLGQGLFMIRGSYNLTFAEFRDYVLLVETPAGEAFMEEALALIEAAAPGKPLRAVATHFHFDHVGGVRTLVARGIPVLTTPDAEAVIGRSLASRQAMRPDALARAPRAAEIERVSGRRVIDDGSQRVELYDFGPTPHVAQLLAAYYPRQRLLHVGDLFDTLTTEAVVAGSDAEVLAARIGRLGLDVERIVPTHGVPVTMKHLEQALELRRQYREGIR